MTPGFKKKSNWRLVNRSLLEEQELNITPNPKKNDKIIVWDFKVGRYGNKKMIHLDYVFI